LKFDVVRKVFFEMLIAREPVGSSWSHLDCYFIQDSHLELVEDNHIHGVLREEIR